MSPDLEVYNIEVRFSSALSDEQIKAFGLSPVDSTTATGSLRREQIVTLCKDAGVSTLEAAPEHQPS